MTCLRGAPEAIVLSSCCSAHVPQVYGLLERGAMQRATYLSF